MIFHGTLESVSDPVGWPEFDAGVSMLEQTLDLQTARGVFRVRLDGEHDAPVLVLSNSLGTTHQMWHPQVADFAQHYRVLRYDTRGHGHSLISPGPYTFDDLGQDVLAILDALQIEQVSFCGISMGGHTGLWLGIHAAHRLHALVVCNSAAKIGSPEVWQDRVVMLMNGGQESMQVLARTAPQRWFTTAFVHSQPEVVQCVQRELARIDVCGYVACCQALATSDLRSAIHAITIPTLLLTGDRDPVTTVADSQAMQAAIPNARLAVLLASHLSNIEADASFTASVLRFLSEQIES